MLKEEFFTCLETKTTSLVVCRFLFKSFRKFCFVEHVVTCLHAIICAHFEIVCLLDKLQLGRYLNHLLDLRIQLGFLDTSLFFFVFFCRRVNRWTKNGVNTDLFLDTSKSAFSSVQEADGRFEISQTRSDCDIRNQRL